MTIKDLLQNTRKFDDANDRFTKSRNVHINIKKVTGWVGTKTLLFSADTWSTKNHYSTYLYVTGVDFSDEKDTEHPHRIDIGGDDYYHEDIILDGHDVKVRCGCRDFRFSAGYYCNQNDALYQRGFKPYKRKTTTRPERNPQHTCVLCKHIISLVDGLQAQGIIRR